MQPRELDHKQREENQAKVIEVGKAYAQSLKSFNQLDADIHELDDGDEDTRL